MECSFRGGKNARLLPIIRATQKNDFFLIKKKMEFEENLDSHLLYETKIMWKV